MFKKNQVRTIAVIIAIILVVAMVLLPIFSHLLH